MSLLCLWTLLYLDVGTEMLLPLNEQNEIQPEGKANTGSRAEPKGMQRRGFGNGHTMFRDTMYLKLVIM